tara:strand:+ start:55 stop:1233 length:1179 start_codon:yes stop_codon:yes gene_type:complete
MTTFYPQRMKFGIFMGPFHASNENPTLSIERDLELIEFLDYLGFDEAWIGEHHSGGWEIISSPEVFIATAAERTKHIKLGTGVSSLPYHHPLILINRMILLDHITRGRTMLGVGPGALIGDAYMMGINPSQQRRQMDESLTAMMKLLKNNEPVTFNTDWFSLNEATLHLAPFTKPHLPISVAAAQSPSGMVAAGKHGASVLSMSTLRGSFERSQNMNDFWKIAEKTAKEFGHVMDRNEWQIVIQAFIGNNKKDAMEKARIGAGRFQREYFEQTLGSTNVSNAKSIDSIIDQMVEDGAWCVGTPDDLIEHIKSVSDDSGGYGGTLLWAHEWASRKDTLDSYELIARYVFPEFQQSTINQSNSQKWSIENRERLVSYREAAIEQAEKDYKKPSN